MLDPTQEITVERLLEGLAALPKGQFDRDRFCLRDPQARCPICALADHIAGTTTGYTTMAHESLELVLGRKLKYGSEQKAVWDIVYAADNTGNWLRPQLERALT